MNGVEIQEANKTEALESSQTQLHLTIGWYLM